MFLFSLENVGYLLLMAVPGFIIAKAKLINKESAVSVISVMLLYVCQPFVTFNAFLNTEYKSTVFVGAAACFVITVILKLVLSIIGRFANFYEKDKDKLGIYAFAGSFGNIGYLCVPFLQVLMPNNPEVLLYASSAIAAFNITGWTVGNYLITGDKKFISIKKAILNPATVSLIAALPLFFLNINFIRFDGFSGLKNVIGLFSNLVAPIAMTSLGIKFSDVTLKELFADIKLYMPCFVKLIISPLLAFLMLLVASTFMDVNAIKLNIIAMAAMPVANNLMMFCSLYKKDTALATRVILLSTLISVITIPLSLELLVNFKF